LWTDERAHRRGMGAWNLPILQVKAGEFAYMLRSKEEVLGVVIS
jgi:hypothetical protein